MTHRFALFATLCAAALARPAGAQSLNPGLWQITNFPEFDPRAGLNQPVAC